jgi:hypothetical protein
MESSPRRRRKAAFSWRLTDFTDGLGIPDHFPIIRLNPIGAAMLVADAFKRRLSIETPRMRSSWRRWTTSSRSAA